MDISSIEKFVEFGNKIPKVVNVYFKDRSTATGIFITLRDYSELKAKKFLASC